MLQPLFDIAGRRLGTPADVVRVETRDDIRASLLRASGERLRVVVAGKRTSYWHNLDVEGALVLDMNAFDARVRIDEDAGVATVQSGCTVRALDRWLRAHGYHLPIHPDSFGDTPVGAALSNGVSAGIGMMAGAFASQLRGVEAVLVDGRVVQAGASRFFTGRAGGIGAGVPQVTSLLAGAEGALAVITELDFALAPITAEAWITSRCDDDRFALALALARRFRGRGCPDTIRWCLERGGELAVRVQSAFGQRELELRVAEVAAAMAAVGVPDVRVSSARGLRGEDPDYDARWPGPVGAAWQRDEAHPFAGIDFVVPYGRAEEAWAWAKSLEPSPPNARRLAAYFGSDGVNVGVHCAFDTHEGRARGREELEARLAETAALDAVPYKLGLVWQRHVQPHAETLALLSSIASVFDPDRVLSPGVGAFGMGSRRS